MDVAKAIAILAVIIGHTKYNDTLRIILYTFHLPVFFLISGYFFKFDQDFFHFLSKKVKSYLLPYTFFAGIILLFNYWDSDYNEEFTEQVYEELVYQQRYQSIWFLTSLFLGVMIFWLIFKVTKQNTWGIILICTALSITFSLYDKQAEEALNWNLDSAFIIQFYLAAGYLLKKYDLVECLTSKGLWRLPWMLALLTFGGLLTYANYVITDGDYYELYHMQLGTIYLPMLAAVSISLGIIILASTMQKLRPLVYLGQNTLVYFALHQSVCLALAKDWCSQLPSCFGKYLLLFSITMFLSFLLDLSIRKTPLHVLIGK